MHSAAAARAAVTRDREPSVPPGHQLLIQPGIAMKKRPIKNADRRASQPLVNSEPKPPQKQQHQRAPGLESKLDPAPRWQAGKYRAAGKLDGKVALITGGDSGIGRAVANLYAREGANIAINYLPQEQSDAELVQRTVEALGRRCLLLPADLTKAANCQKIVDRTVEEFGQLDILVSNAAHQVSSEKLEDVSDEQFDLTYKTNIYAYFRLVKAALPHLKPGAAIIATSSVTGILGTENLPEYSSTKGAINAFTKTLAMDLIKRGIRVNAVAPGPVWTPLNPSDAGRTKSEVAQFGSDSPMGRPAQPEELAPAYVFLASDADSSYITGIILQVMGGETAGG
jgi:NAD(P)-dependent dehydrogenase (short-subunit alcohol dehydrogenase family)